MNQNDISKRHDTNQNDIVKKINEIQGLFASPLEKTLLVSIKKIEKIVAAVYLVTEVMDKTLPLTESLRKESLELVTTSYALLIGNTALSHQVLAQTTLRIDQLVSLVQIGTIAQHISSMNADVIMTELNKVIAIITDEATKLKKQEGLFIVASLSSSQPVIPGDMMRDNSFDEAIARYESKRHQNDIKTTLLHQNDIIKDTEKIKTTFKNDIVKPFEKIDRKQEIVSIIKSKGVCTLNDIKLLVKNCSDKTLQREVNTLTAMGVIKKEGNKRWTTYRVLVNN